MFRNRKLFNMLLVLGLIAGILASCAQPTPEPTQAPVEPTEEPAEPAEPEPSEPEDVDLLDQVMEAGTLLVSSDPNYAPQSFLNDAGELDGFDVETAKEVAKRLGVDVEFVTPDWDLITAGGWAGRWDISIGSMTPTDERSEVLWFTDAYYYTPAVFAIHKDNSDITSVDDLSGKVVGLGTATTYESWLNDTLSILGGEIMYDPPDGVEVKPYTTDSEAIQDLALGDGVRLDAVMSAQPTIQEAMNSGVPLKYLGTPAFYEPLVFSLDKSRGTSDKMVAKLNEILEEMHSDGTLTELSTKWYGIDITSLVEPEDAPPPEPTTMDLLDEIMEAGKLLVSTDPNYAPQSFLNDDGELDGFDVETAKEVAKRLGVELEFVTPDWDLITAGGWAGRWDLSIGSMTPTDERSEVLWFTDAYYYTPAVIAVHKDNSDITSVEDLTGQILGLGTATTYESWFDGSLSILGGEIAYEAPEGVEVKPYTTDSEAIQDLALGDGVRLNAVMSAQPTIEEAISSGVPLKIIGTPAFYEPLVFSLDKSRGPSDLFVEKLNEILAEMHSDGTLKELSIKWYGFDITTLVLPE
jgi:polar amino acid transport system substrate-binding protein